jgi:prepilin-type N-terminal cleavage/methylation domain-containing protein
LSPNHLFTSKNKKAAFTLAEVLITLGIIGIVAAITLPTLVAQYKEKVLLGQFKKAYSTLQQAHNRIYYEFDMTVPECAYVGSVISTSDCHKVKSLLPKVLKVIKTCENNAYPNGCIPEYDGYGELYREQVYPDLSEDEVNDKLKVLYGFLKNNILYNNPAYVLEDGTIIILYASSYPNIMAVDINGKKAPNKWGYDLFAFDVRNIDGKYKICPADYIVSKGGKVTSKMIKSIGQ